jgi:hypothetical protein
MFNPRPRVERVAFGDDLEAWVVDDALTDPEAWVEGAAQARGEFVDAPYNAYPGLEWRLPGEVADALAEWFALHLRARLGGRRTRSHWARLSLATRAPAALSPLQRLCHRDRLGATPDETVAACTLYLFRDAALGGTSFFRPRQGPAETDALMARVNGLDAAACTALLGEPAYLTRSNDFFELAGVVPPAFNRAVFYDGSRFHSSHLERPERLSDDPRRGRLTLNGFFVCRRSAG